MTYLQSTLKKVLSDGDCGINASKLIPPTNSWTCPSHIPAIFSGQGRILKSHGHNLVGSHIFGRICSFTCLQCICTVSHTSSLPPVTKNSTHKLSKFSKLELESLILFLCAICVS